MPILEFAYNSSKHASLGYRPFMLMYGFQPLTPIEVNIHCDKLESKHQILRYIQEMLHIARDKVKITQDRDTIC